MSKQETLDLIEGTLDAAEAAKEVVIEHENLILPIALAAGIVWGTVGFMAGYQLAKRRLKLKYEQLAEEEITAAKLFYARKNAEQKGASPAEIGMERPDPETLRDAAEALLQYKGRHPEAEKEDGDDEDEPRVEVDVSVNVFTDRAVPEEFDMEKEVASRTPDRPYIIHHDEYMDNEPSHEQVTLTYYEGDNVLSDDGDQHIPLVDDVIGESNLRFGYGSGDKDTVFIRNEKMSTDFEVVRSDGKYAHEVLGLQHANVMGGSRGRDRQERRNPTRRLRDDGG